MKTRMCQNLLFKQTAEEQMRCIFGGKLAASQENLS